MRRARVLTLRYERLIELTPYELAGVAAGDDPTKPLTGCITETYSDLLSCLCMTERACATNLCPTEITCDFCGYPSVVRC